MATCRVDRRGLQRKLRAMASASPAARESAVKVMAGEVVRRVLLSGPRDTNRYLRGWAQAGNAAGVGPFFVPPLKAASWGVTILRRLTEHERFWQRIVARYERQGRSDKWARRAQRDLEKAREQIRRFHDTAGGAVIGFNIIGGGRAPTVRHKIYGGAGRVVRIGEKTVVELHNKEAHASLVEWRYGTMRSASRAFRGVGLRTGGRAYIRKMEEAARSVA